MNDRYPEATELDQSTEDEVTRIMDTRGFSRAEAERILAVRENDKLIYSRTESLHQHPSASSKYSRHTLPPVGEDSEDAFTGIIGEKQAVSNTIGAATVRAVIHANDQDSAQQRAINRAKEERRGRRW